MFCTLKFQVNKFLQHDYKFTGVRCYDTVEGYQCGPCPSGYTGDGQRCKPRAGCELNPCSPGTIIYNM